jgi:hypothetical protein
LFVRLVASTDDGERPYNTAIDEAKSSEVERIALRESTLLFRTELGRWVPRKCSLFRDKLLIQKAKADGSIGSKIEINVLLSSCKIASVMDTPHAFQILTPNKLYYVAANCMLIQQHNAHSQCSNRLTDWLNQQSAAGEEMLAWITQIRECVHATIKRQQTLAVCTVSRTAWLQCVVLK